MDNCIQATKKILTSHDIKHTSKYLKDSILSHPDYPSLLSISDTLEKYYIETLAVKLDFEKLLEMPLPSIVQVKVKRQHLFFVLKSVFDNKVSYYDNKNKLIESSKEDFLKIWTGICLLVETTEDSKEKDIEKKITSRRTLNILIGSIALLLLSWTVIVFFNSEVRINTSSTFYTITYTFLKFIGITVGVFLLWFDVDQYNPTLQSFCMGDSKKTNCNAVLGSKHAKLLDGTLSLSLLSFSYFFGTLSFLLVYDFLPTALAILEVLSFISIPILIISIYYQAVVIKQWCKFCIIIQGVLIAEIVISFFSKFYKIPIENETLPLLWALLLIPILGWKVIKPLLEQEKETNVYKRLLKKIKNNPDVLEGLLIKSRKIEGTTEGLGISINQEKKVKYHVVKVCNPYCGPCAKAHPILEDLVNAGKINLQILFTARSSKDTKGKPVSHFLAIDEQGNKTKTQQALDDWYHAEEKDYEVFASKYPMNGELEKQNNKIEAMRNWCEAEHITHTPTIFINEYELPKEYSVEDLKEVLQ
ncbi:cysteine peptidase family C39 domain-containing protein [Flavivirga spongiicola]|uniref:Cysteine peptidase family C39 domain-containing protein n=1 Tax=Flavivirga spongiicola TaxID=421621 RepID=A0ABU7XW26_9FLAO|nr:cysteine peptidase family C39 domain-containing protein [Flavivirga sp. MEBiC05379]MDO5979787.1 cysteine peptidase family C39 domain-containing protein [Flavivirga sp. MEBiC05379]